MDEIILYGVDREELDSLIETMRTFTEDIKMLLAKDKGAVWKSKE